MNPYISEDGKEELNKQTIPDQPDLAKQDDSKNTDNTSNEEPKDEPKKKERKGRRKIKIEFITDKSRRHITFSKRKSGIMKKAYELATLTGTQVLLLVASETGHVYTFATPKLQPLITKPEGKNLIQSCLNAPDVTPTQNPPQGMQRVAYGDGQMYGADNVSYDDSDKKLNRMKDVPMNYGIHQRGSPNVLTVPHGMPQYIYQQQFTQQIPAHYQIKGQYPTVQPIQMHNQHHSHGDDHHQDN